jgi:hypothetical protein
VLWLLQPAVRCNGHDIVTSTVVRHQAAVLHVLKAGNGSSPDRSVPAEPVPRSENNQQIYLYV